MSRNIISRQKCQEWGVTEEQSSVKDLRVTGFLECIHCILYVFFYSCKRPTSLSYSYLTAFSKCGPWTNCNGTTWDVCNKCNFPSLILRDFLFRKTKMVVNNITCSKQPTLLYEEETVWRARIDSGFPEFSKPKFRIEGSSVLNMILLIKRVNLLSLKKTFPSIPE